MEGLRRLGAPGRVGGGPRRARHSLVEGHLVHEIPPLLAEAVRAWQGYSGSVSLAEGLLLHVPDKDAFLALEGSARLRPLLQASLGQGWLLVRPGCRKQVEALLEELEFPVGGEHPDGHLPPVHASGPIPEPADEAAEARGFHGRPTRLRRRR